MENIDNQLKITTLRNAAGVCSDLDILNEVIEIRNRSECIINWLISAKMKVKSIPINMRKIVAYAASLRRFIPLVLRKRVMYDEIVNGI